MRRRMAVTIKSKLENSYFLFSILLKVQYLRKSKNLNYISEEALKWYPLRTLSILWNTTMMNARNNKNTTDLQLEIKAITGILFMKAREISDLSMKVRLPLSNKVLTSNSRFNTSKNL
jgi:hypothetical protein